MAALLNMHQQFSTKIFIKESHKSINKDDFILHLDKNVELISPNQIKYFKKTPFLV